MFENGISRSKCDGYKLREHERQLSAYIIEQRDEGLSGNGRLVCERPSKSCVLRVYC